MFRSTQILNEITDSFNKKAKILGLDILTPDYTVLNVKFILLVTFMISYLLVSVYCFVIYSDNFVKLIFCGVTFGFLIKAAVQMICDISQRDILCEMIRMIGMYYKLGCETGVGSDDIIIQFCVYIKMVIKFTNILYIAAGSTTLFYPIISKIVFNELILPYGFELPFAEPFSMVGYTMNFIYSTMCSVLCVIGFQIGDGFIVLTIVPIYAVYAVLIELLDTMKNLENVDDKNEMETRENRLNDIIKLHQMLLVYVDVVGDFFSSSNFLCINTIIAQCVASLFALIVSQWYIGAIFVICNIFQIFIYCIFGQLLSIMQERFYTKLTELTWIDKTKKEKRIVLFMLTRTQKMTQLTYVTGSLNLDTFVMVKKN